MSEGMPSLNGEELEKTRQFKAPDNIITSGISERELSDHDLIDQGAEWQNLEIDSPWLFVPNDIQNRIKHYEPKLISGRHNWYKLGTAPVAITAPHALTPTEYELTRIQSLNIEKGFSDKKIRDHYDGYTGSMALTLADSQANIFISRRPRTVIDQNRAPGTMGTDTRLTGRKEEIAGDRLNSQSLSEYFSLLKNSIENSVGLDSEGKAQKPFLVISLHGLANYESENEGADIILGARKFNSASEKMINWLITRIRQMGISIDFENSGHRKKFTGTRVLEIARDGDESLGFSGLGDNIQVVQMEVVARVRKNKERRKQLGNILAQIIDEFSQQFPDSESLR